MYALVCYSGMDKRWTILYDGYCNLCSRTVQWIVRNDRKGRFSFVPLQQAELAEGPPIGPSVRQADVLKEEQFAEDTVLLHMDEKLYSRSTAVLRIALKLRFPWPVLGIFLLVPRFIRDPIYDLVARNRIRWFGRRDKCYIP